MAVGYAVWLSVSQGCAPKDAVTGPNGSGVAGPPVLLEASLDSVVLDRWGDGSRLGIVARDSIGRVVATPSLVWSSSDTNVVTVDATGQLLSRLAGTAVVEARAASSAALSVTVAVRVALQRNVLCTLPGSPSTPPAVNTAVPTWTRVPQESAFADDVRPSRGGGVAGFALDVDRDGDLDFVVADDGSVEELAPGRLLVWRNDAGFFRDATAAVLEPDSVAEKGTREFEIADFNGDGYPDVFRGQSGYDRPPYPGTLNTLLYSRVDGGFDEVGALKMQPYARGYAHSTASGDFDCDGDPDLFVGNLNSETQSQRAFLYVNAGGMLTHEPSRIPSLFAAGTAAAISSTSCDLDRDGDVDLVIGRMGSDTPQYSRDFILVNDGFGNFRLAPATLPAPPFGVGSISSDVWCTDLDRDGWPDLVWGYAESNTSTTTQLAIWANRGNLEFDDVPLATPVTRSVKGVVDFNADGWPDLLIDDSYGGLLNRASFMFDRLPEAQPGSFFFDVDGDGLLDAIWPGLYNSHCSCPPELYLHR
jgi:hypothetical protein